MSFVAERKLPTLDADSQNNTEPLLGKQKPLVGKYEPLVGKHELCVLFGFNCSRESRYS